MPHEPYPQNLFQFNLCPGPLAYLSASGIKAAAGVKVIDREYRSISKP